MRLSKDSYFGDLEKIDEQDMIELNEFLKEIKEVCVHSYTKFGSVNYFLAFNKVLSSSNLANFSNGKIMRHTWMYSADFSRRMWCTTEISTISGNK